MWIGIDVRPHSNTYVPQWNAWCFLPEIKYKLIHKPKPNQSTKHTLVARIAFVTKNKPSEEKKTQQQREEAWVGAAGSNV